MNLHLDKGSEIPRHSLPWEAAPEGKPWFWRAEPVISVAFVPLRGGAQPPSTPPDDADAVHFGFRGRLMILAAELSRAS